MQLWFKVKVKDAGNDIAERENREHGFVCANYWLASNIVTFIHYRLYETILEVRFKKLASLMV